MKKILYFWLPPFIWGALIFTVSGNSTATVTDTYWGNFFAKKLAHLVEYAIFSILLFRSFKGYGFNLKRSFFNAIVVCSLFGFTDEFHQGFTPGRQSRLFDVIIDTIGAAIGGIIVWKLLPKAPKKLRDWATKLDLL